MVVRRVARGLWLGIAAPSAVPRAAPALRLAADRAAADLAERAAVATAGRTGTECTVSRSHTGGAGAALVGAAGERIGVDLVELERVGARHARAVTSPAERQALAPWSPERPALAWALKEAAAKATGEPARCFPEGIRIEPSGTGVRVRRIIGVPQLFTAGWLCWGEYLCAWVRESRPCPDSPGKAVPGPIPSAPYIPAVP